MLIDGRRMVTTTLLMLGGQISATLAGAAMGSDATTIEIAPGVRMPYVSDGIILDAGRWSRNHTGEVKGLDLFFKLGGRGVDTAWSYHNQPEVGLAIREASIPREEIFLTTKIECMGSTEAAYNAIQTDLRQLGLKQIDLVIIHAPYHGYGEPYSNCSKGPAGAAARQATWKGMEQAVKNGLTRAIGLSNFDVEYMTEIMVGAEIPPAVNQCCLCVGYQQNASIAFAKQHGITYEAVSSLHRHQTKGSQYRIDKRTCLQYSPLGGKDIGGKSVLDYPQLKAIAKAHPGKSTAQIALRWLVQHGHPFTTATGRQDYIIEDLDLFDFTLTDAEMESLDAISLPMPNDCNPNSP